MRSIAANQMHVRTGSSKLNQTKRPSAKSSSSFDKKGEEAAGGSQASGLKKASQQSTRKNMAKDLPSDVRNQVAQL